MSALLAPSQSKVCRDGQEAPRSIIPDGYECVGTPVPLVGHWKALQSRPEDFDPNSIWSYFQKLKETATGKQSTLCVFCLKMFAGYNATKLQFHLSVCPRLK